MALLTILVILVVFSLRRTREVTFGSVFFLLMLLPSFTNYAKAGDIFFASDRYAYIASIGLFFLVGSAASALLARRPRLRLPLAGAGSLAVLLLILAAHARSLVWKDSEMLYLDVLGKYPGTPSIQYNLGLVYDERGEDDRAIPYYEEAIRLRPDYADAHNNLGAIFLDRGLLDQAIASFERALQANPNHAKARANLGSAYGKKGMYEEGLRELLRARGGG
jgi:tetratricopeptide (TPR) repeat protein